MLLLGFLLSASIALTFMYMAYAVTFEGDPSVLSLHGIFPPFIFFLTFVCIFLYLSSRMGNSLSMQFLAFIASLLVSMKISAELGKITGNGFDKKVEQMIDNILMPFRIIRNIWNNIKFAFKQIWNAIINFFRVIIYTPIDALVSAWNIFAEGVIDILNAILELLSAFGGIFSQLGDIFNNIVSVGGSIPKSKLPPLPPLPPIPK